MTTLHHPHAPATNSRLVSLLDQFPAGCDSDFDDDREEIERQFAELRLLLAND